MGDRQRQTEENAHRHRRHDPDHGGKGTGQQDIGDPRRWDEDARWNGKDKARQARQGDKRRRRDRVCSSTAVEYAVPVDEHGHIDDRHQIRPDRPRTLAHQDEHKRHVGRQCHQHAERPAREGDGRGTVGGMGRTAQFTLDI